MKKLTVELQTVTPLFSGGAEPRGEPELRTAPFKGLLRFWWRALKGGVVTSLAELAKEEENIFGSTNCASKIILRLNDELGDKSVWSFNQYPGVDYLFFSVKGNRQNPDREGFEEDQIFKLTLQTRLGIDGDDAFKQACAAFWLLVRLGGVGARSRRGGGCLKVVKEPVGDWPKDFPSLLVNATSPTELKEEVQNGLKAIYKALKWSRLSRIPSIEYNVLHPQSMSLKLLNKKWDSWPEALDEVGRAYRQFRSRRQPDYDNVKAVVGGRSTKLNPVERAAFGLPIVFYYRSLGGQRGMLEGRDASRRASPLLFHVTQLVNPKYVVELIHFKAPLLPRDSELMLRPRGRPAFANAPDDKLIDQFMRCIGQQGHHDRQGNLFIAPMLEVNL